LQTRLSKRHHHSALEIALRVADSTSGGIECGNGLIERSDPLSLRQLAPALLSLCDISVDFFLRYPRRRRRRRGLGGGWLFLHSHWRCRGIFLLTGVLPENKSGSLHREVPSREPICWIDVGLTNRINGDERYSLVSS
jgi:hypothetical protein